MGVCCLTVVVAAVALIAAIGPKIVFQSETKVVREEILHACFNVAFGPKWWRRWLASNGTLCKAVSRPLLYRSRCALIGADCVGLMAGLHLQKEDLQQLHPTL